MKRFSLCVLVLLALGAAVLPGQALAMAKGPHWPGAHLGGSVLAPSRAARASGPYAISGSVLNFDGTPATQSEVDWGWWDVNDNYNYGGYSPAGTGNTFSFPSVSSNPGNDDLIAYYNVTPQSTYQSAMDTWNNDFSTNNDASFYSYTLQPGQVNLNIANAANMKARVRGLRRRRHDGR